MRSNGKTATDTRRCKHELYLEILRVVNTGTTTKTRIMQSAHIDSRVAHEHFEALVLTGMICETEPETQKQYCITARGQEFLNKLKDVEEIIGEKK